MEQVQEVEAKVQEMVEEKEKVEQEDKVNLELVEKKAERKETAKMEAYDEDSDTIFLSWGGKTKHSRELRNVNLIVDFDKDDNIVGLEISDFNEALDESQKVLNSIFKEKDELHSMDLDD